MRDLLPLVTAVVGMGLAMWMLHIIVESWW
jgi:hypothetical protein